MDIHLTLALRVFIVTFQISFFHQVDGHVCIPEERFDAYGELRWSVTKVERCKCQAVAVPRITTSKHQACANNIDKQNNTDISIDKLFFIDDLLPLINRQNWIKEKLDVLLDRAECYVNECDSSPCLNKAVCHDRFERYICQCGRGFKGINCENDIEAPEIVCPIGQQNTSTDYAKPFASFTYNTNATDNSFETLDIHCSKNSGSPFEIGDTIVTCVALDDANNTDTCKFTVNVKDAEAPVITCPGNQNHYTEPNKAYAEIFFDISASDNSQVPSVSCTNESGSYFEIGDTIITCTALDEAGNVATCQFTLNVKDVEDPAIICPENQAKNTSEAYVIVFFKANSSDNAEKNPTVSCTKESGSHFEIGETSVTCQALDVAGNIATCQFTVNVTDHGAPEIICPGNEHKYTDPSKANAKMFFKIIASDNSQQIPAVSCTHESGSQFEMGDTVVTCTALDDTGNFATCTFSVKITDGEAPVITCENQYKNTDPTKAYATVSFLVTASDNSQQKPSLSCSPVSGSHFDIGSTNVDCEARDNVGNLATYTFSVLVTDAEPPVIACPGNQNKNAHSTRAYATLSFQATASDNSQQIPSVSCSPVSGSHFYIGNTNVECEARDEKGNIATCIFSVSVTDHEPPVITCPGNLYKNTDPTKAYATVYFGVPATDNSQQIPPVSCSPVSGSHINIGSYYVYCEARDNAGNRATCTFVVSVTDTERPSITCPSNIIDCSDWSGTYAYVSFTVTATDNSGSVEKTCDRDSGERFDGGDTTVSCSASDDANNVATCTFKITVVAGHPLCGIGR